MATKITIKRKPKIRVKHPRRLSEKTSDKFQDDIYDLDQEFGLNNQAFHYYGQLKSDQLVHALFDEIQLNHIPVHAWLPIREILLRYVLYRS